MREILAREAQENDLGKRGENLARCVVFDISAWQKEYGEGFVQLIHQRNGDNVPYPCAVTVDGGKAYWNVTSADVDVAGRGHCELQYWVGDAIVKSATYITRTSRSMSPASETVPEPQQPWMDSMLSVAAEANEHANAAEAAAENAATYAIRQPIVGGNANWMVWDGSAYVDSGMPSYGPQGEKGERGERGDTGATGATGPQGERGEKGDKGDTGEKGDTGTRGPQGLRGIQGIQGIAGERGEKGETGAQGPQGIQGIQGIQGVQGIQGEKGDKGDQGEVGPRGPQGVQGPEGPRGFSGVMVETAGYVNFSVTEDGMLMCTYTGDEAPAYSINEDGYLILTV